MKAENTPDFKKPEGENQHEANYAKTPSFKYQDDTDDFGLWLKRFLLCGGTTLTATHCWNRLLRRSGSMRRS
jgi:hypothetical protein